MGLNVREFELGGVKMTSFPRLLLVAGSSAVKVTDSPPPLYCAPFPGVVNK